MNKKNIGFTLIELLVVIAIIGILAGVTLVNLNSESSKAKDARIQSALNQMRTRMESIRVESLTLAYPAANTTDPEIVKLKGEITSQGRTATIYSNSSNAWCAEAQMLTVTTHFFCVDSRGYAGKGTLRCNSGTYKCQ